MSIICRPEGNPNYPHCSPYLLTQRVQVANSKELGFGVIVILVQVLRKYMTIWYLDPYKLGTPVVSFSPFHFGVSLTLNPKPFKGYPEWDGVTGEPSKGQSYEH